jgi:hypothetical protein
MSFHGRLDIGLLMLGAIPRLAVAAIVVLLLWVGFFWATATPGAL